MWTSEEIIDATGGRLQGPVFSADSVAIDSRKLKSGALFVALKGENADGHEYIRAAVGQGAVAALVEQVPADVQSITSYIIVKDVYQALLKMAHAARTRMKGRIIAVTGSVGKTSTKEAIRLAAASAGKVYATQGNLNNHIGLPLSLCNMPRDAAFGVLELGMNHAGEISFLTQIAKPDVAVITNVEAVHLEFFSDVQEIARAKAEIMEGIAPSGTVILNHDNVSYPQLLAAAKARGIEHIVTFGEHEESQCRLVSYTAEPTGARIEAIIMGTPILYQIAAIGRHWASVTLAALAAVTAARGDLANAAAALAHFSEPEGRGKLQLLPLAAGRHITLIDDCYNASPASVKAALSKLGEVHEAFAQKGRRVAVLGDMLELGDTSAELHRSLLPAMQAAGVDKVFTAGKMMGCLHDILPANMKAGHAETAAQLAPLVLKAISDGDVVLIKGSRGSRMDIVRDALQNAATTSSAKDTVRV